MLDFDILIVFPQLTFVNFTASFKECSTRGRPPGDGLRDRLHSCLGGDRTKRATRRRVRSDSRICGVRYSNMVEPRVSSTQVSSLYEINNILSIRRGTPPKREAAVHTVLCSQTKSSL